MIASFSDFSLRRSGARTKLFSSLDKQSEPTPLAFVPMSFIHDPVSSISKDL